MKNLFIGLILLSSQNLFSQNLEIIGGLNSNSFFNFVQSDGRFNSSYNSEQGYTIRVGLGDIKLESLNFRFTLSYEKYGGEIDVSFYGLGGGTRTQAAIDKSVISLGVFPINFKIIDRIDLNFGFEISGLINENYSGTSSGHLMGDSWSYDLNEKYDRYSAKMYFGLRGRIAYDFNVSEKLAISPQYSYYLGLSREFDKFPDETKSMRHFFGIGLQRKII